LEETIMAIKYNVSDKGKAGRKLLAQVTAARQLAEMRKNLRFKPGKSNKTPYKPGVTVLGLSAVSEALKKEFGRIPGRRERRSRVIAVENHPQGFVELIGVRFAAHYNGESPVYTPHEIRPERYGTWNRR
jgi:hypothetical protein